MAERKRLKGIETMASKPKAAQFPGSGDVELLLDGHRLVMRPTLNAGLAISRQAGGIRAAIDKVVAMDFDTIVTVIRLGIGQEEARRVRDLDRLVYENGLMDTQGEVLGKCLEFLTNLARGGRPADTVSGSEGDENPPTPETQS